MNLKEAFRYQNAIEQMISQIDYILSDEDNVTITKRTFLYKKADPESQNEVVTEKPATDYYKQINKLAELAMFLMSEREKLSYQITKCKRSLPIDLDSETSLNRYRQNLAKVYRGMARIKGKEVTEPKSGTGYRFNNEGNQVAYRCDVERVTTINFDRDLVRRYAAELSAKAEKASLDIDRVLIESVVDYDPPFDANANLDEVFEDFIAK